MAAHKPYTKEEIIEFLKAGEDLEYADLEGGLLSEINLSKMSLKGANLAGADLRLAKLEDTDFTNANLENAKLDMARLNGANLTGACLKKASLTQAIMRHVIICNTDFTEADLRYVHMNGADGCSKAIFNGANLQGAHLEHTGLDSQDLKKVGVKLDKATFGLKTRVFDFFKVEEESKHYFKKLFSFLFKKSTKVVKKVLPGKG